MRLVQAAGALGDARAASSTTCRRGSPSPPASSASPGRASLTTPRSVTAERARERFAADLDRGLTGVGPHRDEMRVTAGERELRTHGSQGEQRVAVLALLLAEAELLAERSGVPPLLLLDDVLSELDGDRRGALVDRIRGGSQVLVTAAATGALPAARISCSR